MSFRRRLVAASCALTIAVTALSVHAAPSASDKETARALMKDAEAKRSKGDLEGALKDYAAAHAIMNVPTTGLELGRTQAALGQLVEARDTLLAVTRMPEQPGESPAFAPAREQAAKLAEEIEPRIPSLTIELENVPEGETPVVKIDGRPILAATVGVARKHNPGKHVIAVSVGGAEKKSEVELGEGESKEVTIDLAEAKSVGAAEEPEPEPAPPESPGEAPTGRSPLVWIGFGSAAAFGAVGAVTGILAFSKAGAAKDGCIENRCPPETHDDLDASKTFGTLSTVSFVLAGVGIGVGVWGLVSGGAPAKTTGSGAPAIASLRWFVSPTGVGLAGAF